MNPPVKLAVFVLALGALFGIGAGVGTAVGPIGGHPQPSQVGHHPAGG